MLVRSRLHRHSPYEGFSAAGASLDLQGWHSSDPIFESLIEELRPQTIIEVGTWKGASAIGMANLVKARGLDTEVVCVDTWLGAIEFWTSHDDASRYGSLNLRHGYPSVYYTFLANVVLSGHAERITPLPQTSVNGARWLSSQGVTAELIYIDASHEEPDVLADLTAYWPVLKPGGVMFGDDFSAAWPSVGRAVRTFAAREGLTLEEANEFWILRRPREEPLEVAFGSGVDQSVARPVLLVHGAEAARATLGPLVDRFGYRLYDGSGTTRGRRKAAAIWVGTDQPMPPPDLLRELGSETQSIFWLEHPGHGGLTAASWSDHWGRRLAEAGGSDRVVPLHPYLPLAQQRERCELLCRRLGIDLSALRLHEQVLSPQPRPPRAVPTSPAFARQLETLAALGVSPLEFFSFGVLHPLLADPSLVRTEVPPGGAFEAYGPTHFLLHPPNPGQGWTRLAFAGATWRNARYFAATLRVPNLQAPAIKFEWNIAAPDGRRLQVAETTLQPGQTVNWLVRLPPSVQEGSVPVLATQVQGAPANAFAWAVWRDPMLLA